MNWNRVFAAAALVAVAGCSPSPKHARHTVEEYLADAALRQKQLKVCMNDPGTLQDNPDCVNAGEAERRDGMGTVKDRLQIIPK